MTSLAVDDLTVVCNGCRLLDGFSLHMEAGEAVALLGPNGAGKTTLLRCILGLVRQATGTVRIRGVDTHAISARRRAELVGWLAQHITTDGSITVLEFVATARFRYDESRRASERAAQLALQRVDAVELAERRLGQLSGGERQRVALAALLAQEAAILLLDEPANHLDPARQAQSYALLGALQESSTMLVVTHDVNLLAHLKHPERVRVVGMKQGRCVFELPFGSRLLCDALSELYDVPMHQFFDEKRTLIAPATVKSP